MTAVQDWATRQPGTEGHSQMPWPQSIVSEDGAEPGHASAPMLGRPADAGPCEVAIPYESQSTVVDSSRHTLWVLEWML